jgi:hypothetical protein
VGFIIGNHREDFVASVSGDPSWIGRFSWARLPGLAQVFATRAEPESIVPAWRRCDEDWCVCGLWDRREQWLVNWDWND